MGIIEALELLSLIAEGFSNGTIPATLVFGSIVLNAIFSR